MLSRGPQADSVEEQHSDVVNGLLEPAWQDRPVGLAETDHTIWPKTCACSIADGSVHRPHEELEPATVEWRARAPGRSAKRGSRQAEQMAMGQENLETKTT